MYYCDLMRIQARLLKMDFVVGIGDTDQFDSSSLHVTRLRDGILLSVAFPFGKLRILGAVLCSKPPPEGLAYSQFSLIT